jgi:AraC-like DNA-binding protein
MHGLVLQGTRGALLHDFLLALPGRVGMADGPQAPHLVQAIRHMLAACLAPSPDAIERAQPQVDSVLLRRARCQIDAHMHDPHWGVDQLSAALRLSRSTLYRIFAPLGGVAEFIRSRRLARAHILLAEPGSRCSVSEVAHRTGFKNDSYFSRAFRQTYGYSPRHAREAIGTTAPRPAGQSAPGEGAVFLDWIHGLR